MPRLSADSFSSAALKRESGWNKKKSHHSLDLPPSVAVPTPFCLGRSIPSPRIHPKKEGNHQIRCSLPCEHPAGRGQEKMSFYLLKNFSTLTTHRLFFPLRPFQWGADLAGGKVIGGRFQWEKLVRNRLPGLQINRQLCRFRPEPIDNDNGPEHISSSAGWSLLLLRRSAEEIVSFAWLSQVYIALGRLARRSCGWQTPKSSARMRPTAAERGPKYEAKGKKSLTPSGWAERQQPDQTAE